jgi:hypothetical protein
MAVAGGEPVSGPREPPTGATVPRFSIELAAIRKLAIQIAMAAPPKLTANRG